MNKKYLSVVLFGALLATSAGTFTSCKDYDDDIKGLQEQIDKSGSTITDLQTQLTTLKAAAEAAQTTADAAKAAAVEAKAAADAAKAAGDQAKADAADALARAKAAEAAAATAKTEAIAEATKLVEALRNSMQEAIDKKLDVADFEAAAKLLGARIDGIEAGLSKLENGAVKENTEAIKTAMDLIEALQAADEDFATTLRELDEYVKITLEAKIDANAEEIKAAQDDIKAAQDDLANLWTEIGGEGGLKDLIGANKTAISELEGKITGELDAIKEDVKGIQSDIKLINGKISAINQNLSGLHTLVTCRLTSISLAPDLFVDGIEAVKFNSLKYSPMDVKDENASIPALSYKFSTAALAIAHYHFNPASFKLANADYGYIDRTAEVISTTRAIAASKLVEIVGTPIANPETGTVDFKLLRLNAHSTQPGLDQTNLIALQATLKGDAVDENETNVAITSPYVSIYDNVLDAEDVRIADKATLVSGKDDAHYATIFSDCAELPTEYITYEMAYDKVFNLKELVATCYGNGNHAEFPIEDYNLSYKFSTATSPYKIQNGETVTDQQDWFLCNDEKEGLYQAKDLNKELIGRTPIVKVELVDNAGNVVRRAFVKLIIVAEKYEDLNVGTTETLTYECATSEANFEISEQFIRDNVYRVITNGKESSMSHEEFWNLYDAAGATTAITKNGKAFTMSSKPKIVDGATSAGVATKKVTWSFAHGELGEIKDGSTFTASVTVKNKLASSEYPANVTFTITVDVKLPTWTWAGTENAKFWENNMYLAYVSTPLSATSPASECLFRTSLTQAYVANSYKVTGLPECTTDYYEVIATVNNGKSIKKGQAGFISGVVVDGTDITLTKNNAAVEAALNSTLGLQALVAHKFRLESGDIFTVNTFTVNFIRPVDLNMPGGLALTDANDGGGDAVSFQWNGLLTDWRNKAIVAPVWENVIGINSFWTTNCAPEAKVIPAYQEVITPAQVTPEYGKVSFTTGGSMTMYKAKATYKYATIIGRTKTKEFSTADPYLTEEQAAKDLEYQARLHDAGFGYDYVGLVGEVAYTAETVESGTLVEYEYVKGIIYTPAVYETHPAEVVMVAHDADDHTSYPGYDGKSYGETSGCWIWTKTEFDASGWTQGQYWDFYGKFGDVTLNIAKASTDIEYNGNKLPNEDITLKQEGNSLKYINAGAKVTSPYVIFIPATIKYGWGTASATLTVTVNPVN